jgi:hypothetical protein
MESLKLWARNGEAVRQAIELGEIAHIETASEELTDEFLLFAIDSGLLKSWAGSFPDPRDEPEIAMEVIVAAQMAARFAGLYSLRQAGYVWRSARVLGAWGYSVEVVEPRCGLSGRGTADAKLLSGDVVRKLWVQMAQPADLSQPARRPPQEPRSVPPAGPSTRPWMPPRPTPAPTKSLSHWCTGRTSRLGYRCGPLRVSARGDGSTSVRRRTSRWPERLGRRSGAGW